MKLNKYEFRLEKILDPFMEKSHYEVLSKPLDMPIISAPLDEYFLHLSSRDCFNLIRETFLFLNDYSDMKVSINVNHNMLSNSVIFEYILRVSVELKRRNISLSLEVNENSMAYIESKELDSIRFKLELIGVELWLDDFGCGSANFSTLIDNRFSVIKIDKKIFWDFYSKYTGLLIELISFIKSKHCLVVIEGVETQEHLDFALENGCYSQGFFLINN